jgi:hypothetical protein
MKTVEFECEDRYEAEKLASLMSVQKDNTVWVSRVEAVIGNEIVLLKDQQTVMRLKSILTDLLGGQIKIQSSIYLGSIARITIVD